MKIRIENSKQLLSLLQQAEKNNFHFIGTSDEPWFNYSFDPTTQWVQQGGKPDSKVRKSLHSQKVMIIIFWNIDGIQFLDCIDPSQRVNSPDLAPSDFFLLGQVKSNNQKIRFESPEEIVERIREKIETILKETLMAVFQDWKKRLALVINNDGSYISS